MRIMRKKNSIREGVKKTKRKCRIKLVKKLDEELFKDNEDRVEDEDWIRNNDSEDVSEQTEEEIIDITDHVERESPSMNQPIVEIDIDNIGNEEIIVTYSNITNDYVDDEPEVSGEMAKMRRYLMDPTVNPNHQGKGGNTALIRGVQTNDKTVVETLLSSSRVNVNLADNNGFTPLIWAVDMGHLTMVKLLLRRRDIMVNIRDNNGYTALMWGQENLQIMRRLLKHPDIEVNTQDEEGNTALIWAADHGKAEVVRTLLEEERVDTNKQNKEGMTALICAAGQGYGDIVRDLLDKDGTDATIEDNDGYTAMIAADVAGHLDIAATIRYHLYPIQTVC